MSWDGEERRRQMRQDQIDRDRLLTEVHSNMKHLAEWTKSHDVADTTRFNDANEKIDRNTRYINMALGAIIVLNVILHFVK